MKKVKDLILYQVATDRHYAKGDILTFGKEFNVQGKRTYSTSFTDNDIAWHEKVLPMQIQKRFLRIKIWS